MAACLLSNRGDRVLKRICDGISAKRKRMVLVLGRKVKRHNYSSWLQAVPGGVENDQDYDVKSLGRREAYSTSAETTMGRRRPRDDLRPVVQTAWRSFRSGSRRSCSQARLTLRLFRNDTRNNPKQTMALSSCR